MRPSLVIGIPVATVLIGFAYLAASLWVDKDTWDRASSAYQVVFTVMVGLTGCVMGYYFGTKSRAD